MKQSKLNRSEPITRIALAALVAALVGCGGTEEAPQSEDREPIVQDAVTEAEAAVDTDAAAETPEPEAAPVEAEPVSSDPEPQTQPDPQPSLGGIPAWHQDGAFQYEGRDAASAFAEARRIRDARRAAVRAAQDAFGSLYPGQIARIERTTPLRLGGTGGFRVYVLAAADPETD